MPISPSNEIRKQILLSAARPRVWRAISSAAEFGQWFGVRLQGEFQANVVTFGQITHPDYEHLKFEMHVVEIRPERYFSYRWRPYAIDANKDYSAEPMTLVEFTLDDAPDNNRTLLTIVESGFDGIPEARRAEAFRMNDGGWSAQLENIAQHVTGS